jgi:YHS domain-containing protein
MVGAERGGHNDEFSPNYHHVPGVQQGKTASRLFMTGEVNGRNNKGRFEIMKKMVLFGALVLFGVLLIAATAQAETNPPMSFSGPQPDGAMATCPVMGNVFKIDADPAKWSRLTPTPAPTGNRPPVSFDRAQPMGAMASCLVMGNVVKIDHTTPFSVYQGRYYYFCCPDCKKKVDQNPAAYLP